MGILACCCLGEGTPGAREGEKGPHLPLSFKATHPSYWEGTAWCTWRLYKIPSISQPPEQRNSDSPPPPRGQLSFESILRGGQNIREVRSTCRSSHSQPSHPAVIHAKQSNSIVVGPTQCHRKLPRGRCRVRCREIISSNCAF